MQVMSRSYRCLECGKTSTDTFDQDGDTLTAALIGCFDCGGPVERRDTMIHTFHAYAQHTPRAGQRCYDDDLIERESDDVFEISGTPAELREMADALEKQSSQYAWAQARTIRDVLAEAAAVGDI